MSSNLYQFNTTLREFLTKLINIFPQSGNEILQHYRPLLEDNNYKTLDYCKDFMSRVTDYQKDIADKNEEIFRHSICIFPGIDFEVIWNSDFNTPKTKKSIWLYLNVFYQLGTKVMVEEDKKQQKLENLTDEDKMLLNLKEASKESHEEALTQKELFLQKLSDRELIKEVKRRKQDLQDKKELEDDEEDLLNFDPEQGYSMFNAFKSVAGKQFGGITGMLGTLNETFGIDLTNLDMENFDFSNLGNKIQELMTPENIEKATTYVKDLVSNFQTDLDTGNIDQTELKTMFDMFKNGISQEVEKEGEEKSGNQADIMQKMMETSQKLFQNMVPPEVRPQFEAMQQTMMQDPSQLLNMMQNLQNTNSGGDVRGQKQRDRLKKIHEAQKKSTK